MVVKSIMEESNKNYAIILEPVGGLARERRDVAQDLVESRGYSIYDSPDNFARGLRYNLRLADDANILQFTLGASLILMSVCQAVWFPKDWADDQLLKDLYLFAFKYGMTLIVEK